VLVSKQKLLPKAGVPRPDQKAVIRRKSDVGGDAEKSDRTTDNRGKSIRDFLGRLKGDGKELTGGREWTTGGLAPSAKKPG